MAENKRMLCLYGRSELVVTGVREVLSFDELGATLVSEDGELCVEGEGIHISDLDSGSGEIRITGRINSVAYTDDATEKRRGVLGRLFG